MKSIPQNNGITQSQMCLFYCDNLSYLVESHCCN